jgi:hypothetical protein
VVWFLVSLHSDVVGSGSSEIPIAEREVVTSLTKQIASNIVMYLQVTAACNGRAYPSLNERAYPACSPRQHSPRSWNRYGT